jgi:hypothetical protein
VGFEICGSVLEILQVRELCIVRSLGLCWRASKVVLEYMPRNYAILSHVLGAASALSILSDVHSPMIFITVVRLPSRSYMLVIWMSKSF